MSVTTAVLVRLAEEPSIATQAELARKLRCDRRDVALALSVLEVQGLVMRGRDRYGLTKLGHRSVPIVV